MDVDGAGLRFSSSDVSCSLSRDIKVFRYFSSLGWLLWGFLPEIPAGGFHFRGLFYE